MKKKNPEFRLSAIISALVVMFCIGIVYLWGAFQPTVPTEYGWSVDSVTMISPAIVFFYVFGTMIGGFVADRVGPRFTVILGSVLLCLGLFLTSLLSSTSPQILIYITYGVCAGVGVGFAYAGALNCMQKWFPHRRGFATGISVCAFGLSIVVIGPLIRTLIATYDCRTTFRILAFTFPIVAFIMGFIIKNPSEAYVKGLNLPTASIRVRQYTVGEAVKTLEFWSLALSLLCLPAAYMMMTPRVVTLGLDRGLTDTVATLTLSLTGVASTVARLVCATLSDKLGRAWTLWTMAAINLVASLLLIFANNALYIIAVMMIWCGYSGPAGIFPAMTTDAFGTKNTGAIYGLSFMCLGISAPLFALISNLLNPAGAETGNFTASFILAACCTIVPLVMMPLYNVARRKHAPLDRAMIDAEIAAEEKALENA